MKLEGHFSLLVTADLKASERFYCEHFEFEPVFDSDWYVHLAHRSDPGCQIGLIVEGHESLPEGCRGVTQNFVLSLEVGDATGEYERLGATGMTFDVPLRDEPWGQRHFMLTDPAGVVVDVIERIPPSEEFARQYLAGTSS